MTPAQELALMNHALREAVALDQEQRRKGWDNFWITLVYICFGSAILLAFVTCVQPDSAAKPQSARVQTQPASMSAKQVSPAVNELYHALRQSSTLYTQQDTNRDGLNNCIDAATLYYKHHPNKAHVKIVRNNNPVTGMNHLFNLVWADGRWIEVEPQTLYGGGMKAEWGSKYDPAYNKDETDYWSRFAR
jgi:hypothetical protein